MTEREIIEAYERREAAFGGLSKCDPKQVAQDTANILEVPYERVREVLIQHWTTAGSG